MNSKHFNKGFFSFSWIIVLLVINNNHAFPWEGRMNDLDYSIDLDRFIPDDFHGFFYKEQDNFVDFVIGRGCAYLAGYIKSYYTSRVPADDHFWEHSAESFNCDWFSWTEKMCAHYATPRELCCAVYTCGPEYSAMAFNAPQAFIDRCRLNMTSVLIGRRNVPGDPTPNGDMCTDTGSQGKRDTFEFLRQIDNRMPPVEPDFIYHGLGDLIPNLPQDYVGDADSDSSLSEPYLEDTLENDTDSNLDISDSHANESSPVTNISVSDSVTDKSTDVKYITYTSRVGYAPASSLENVNSNSDSTKPVTGTSTSSPTTASDQTSDPQYIVYTNNDDNAQDSAEQLEYIINVKLQRWCFSLSRKIRFDYQFDQRIYVLHSRYWIEDVYSVAIHYRLPSFYAHSLVGCGLDYAMEAFRGTPWHTAFYRMFLW